jgi:hypothetical protein
VLSPHKIEEMWPCYVVVHEEARHVMEWKARPITALVGAAVCAAILLVAGCAVELPKSALPGVQPDPVSGTDARDKAEDQHLTSLEARHGRSSSSGSFATANC